MKIIKPGVLPSELVYLVKCGNCQSILEYLHHEARVYYSQFNDETHDLGPCPFCKKDLYNYNPVPLVP